MKTIVTLSLRGRAFQLEEDGYRRVRNYLDALEAGLRGRDDARDEIERALADKLAACIDAAKTVITAREVDAVLRQMPPSGTPADRLAAASTARKGRRLCRVREGRMIAGLCLGLAVYAKFDVAMVRSLFVILGLFSGGMLVVLYLIAMFVVPEVDTMEQAALAATP